MANSAFLIRRLWLAAAIAGCVAVAAPRVVTAAPDRTLGMALLSAKVLGNATLQRGSGVTAVTRAAPAGGYLVDFDRDVSGCVYSATAFDSLRVASAEEILGVHSSVGVEITDLSGTPTDGAFYLIVFCAQ